MVQQCSLRPCTNWLTEKDPTGLSPCVNANPIWALCHFACEVAGQISPQDPDGLVLSAHWVEEQAALEHLGTDPGYDCEPLRRWLCGEAASGTVYTVKVK